MCDPCYSHTRNFTDVFQCLSRIRFTRLLKRYGIDPAAKAKRLSENETTKDTPKKRAAASKPNAKRRKTEKNSPGDEEKCEQENETADD